MMKIEGKSRQKWFQNVSFSAIDTFGKPYRDVRTYVRSLWKYFVKKITVLAKKIKNDETAIDIKR